MTVLEKIKKFRNEINARRIAQGLPTKSVTPVEALTEYKELTKLKNL